MGHLSLSEIAVQFVNTELIARCYNHIFTWRGYTARFQEEVDQSEALLKTLPTRRMDADFQPAAKTR